MKLSRPRHQDIWKILEKFDEKYLSENNILFGGGTRIAMELSEYRESVDIDFFCLDSKSYRAVRSQVTSNSMGALLADGETLEFLRDIRSDRDAVRAIIRGEHGPIKLEFIYFDKYQLEQERKEHLFPVPYIDRATCYSTKLLANADRYADKDKKDIFDLSVMANAWGDIPKIAWDRAEEKYGLKVVLNGLDSAISQIFGDKSSHKEIAEQALAIESAMAEKIVDIYIPELEKKVAPIRSRSTLE